MWLSLLDLSNLPTSHVYHQNSHHPCGEQVWPAQWQLHGDHPPHHEPVLGDWDVRWGEAEVCLALSSSLSATIRPNDWLFFHTLTHIDFLIPVLRQEPEKHLRAVLLCTEGRPSPHRASLWPWRQTGRNWEDDDRLATFVRPCCLTVLCSLFRKHLSTAEAAVCPSAEQNILHLRPGQRPNAQRRRTQLLPGATSNKIPA